MKLHATTSAHYNTITGYGDGWVEINAQRFSHSMLIMPENLLERWPVERFKDLTADHFAALAQYKPDVLLFGSGARLRFPHPRLLGALRAAGIGVETMDMRAASRTYNILMTEGRRVAAALLIDAA